jgi:two-component system, cell cycle sensor histidine kinase and response regulator CckA
VLGAADGVEALQLVDDGLEPVGVLLDMAMPRMNGEETLRALRERRPRLPILLTSGFSEAVAAQRLLDATGVAFLQKPFGAKQVVEAMFDLLATVGPAATTRRSGEELVAVK